MTAARRKYTDLAQVEADEIAEHGAQAAPPPEPEDRIVDDTEELRALQAERGDVRGIGEDFPIRSLEDLERRDRLQAAAGVEPGPSNDIMSRLNYIPTGGLKMSDSSASQADKMQRMLALVGPEKFRQMVKEGLV